MNILQPEDVHRIIREVESKSNSSLHWSDSYTINILCKYISAVSDDDHRIGYAVTESTLRRFLETGKLD
jgi:hypothetical protein